MDTNMIVYEILDFINSSSITPAINISKKFPEEEYSTTFHLKQLLESKAIEYVTVKNSFTTHYSITDKGKAVYSDLKSIILEKKQKNIAEEEHIEREKKTLELAEEANLIAKNSNKISKSSNKIAKSSDKKASISNLIAFFALVIAIIALFKK